MVKNGGQGKVAGHLIELDPRLYDTLLVELDWLEGYDPAASEGENEYLRVIREIVHENGSRARVWVYPAAPKALEKQSEGLTLIESGDWLAWRKQNHNL